MKLRDRLATATTLAVGGASRRLHLGSGSVIGGKSGLLLAPDLLASLSAGRQIALVSGTNGKTTTTRLLARAIGVRGPVATSSAGANLPGGLVAALAKSPRDAPGVLEVDEAYLGAVADSSGASVVVLLNLSRDQLDRVSETRMLAQRWRKSLAANSSATVVANADDPLVVWAAGGARKVTWVGAGQLWHSDSTGCPWCGGRIAFSESWSCTGCGEERPAPDASLRGGVLLTTDGRALPIRTSLPGRCNLANSAMAATAAGLMGVDEADALAAMADVSEIEGRFAKVALFGFSTRMLLAKNPAGWAELIDLLAGAKEPVVVGINARVADGHDPSWLWDVEFECFADRFVVATGERAADLAVRLRYAGVEHSTVPDQVEALREAARRGNGGSWEHVEYVGNYTAFQQLRRKLERLDRAEESAPPPPPRRVSAPMPPPRRSSGPGASALRVVVVHPDLLGTYGDAGNGRVIAARAAWREMPVELVFATADRPLPVSADIYCLGGGEDGPQVQSAELLASGGLSKAVANGSVVLAVCAGYQVVGESFPDAEGRQRQGVGLLDVSTAKSRERRAVGELTAEPFDEDLRRLTGFENHSAITSLGEGVRPLAKVLSGIGNGAGDGTEGAITDKVVGTYMHGPVLARNPSLADRLLRMATGLSLSSLDDDEENRLRYERLRAVKSRRA